MKYTDIQLTDKELWAQFQSLYQTGNYASALHLSLFSSSSSFSKKHRRLQQEYTK